ncbi:predicted protein [Verticillium alfalfae VaMs.102]|uniref:Predicted protein n=1 Tax=Verticillium alfalfae (strain VaMs.102 / ATCC MYA-4576 / FGSC 10136) TaxID=526221 RepID=C9SS06_VERA1|nr:predicted protein [Verticillium alfalfae VaMs.102]EEY21571.1 predicted protein [Verticillium alfalfae VaMs.102]
MREDGGFRFVTVAEEVGQRRRSHDEPALPETKPFGLSLRLDDLGPVDGILVDPRVARVLPLTARRRPEDVEAAAVFDGREDVWQRSPHLLARRDLWRFRQAAALSGRAYRAVLGMRFRLGGDVIILLQAGLGLGRQAGALVASIRERDEDEGERYEQEGSACNGDGEDPAYRQAAAAAALFSGCHSRGHRDCSFVPSSKRILVVPVTRRTVKRAENDCDASIEDSTVTKKQRTNDVRNKTNGRRRAGGNQAVSEHKHNKSGRGMGRALLCRGAGPSYAKNGCEPGVAVTGGLGSMSDWNVLLQAARGHIPEGRDEDMR